VSTDALSEVTRRLREEMGRHHGDAFGRVQSRLLASGPERPEEASVGGFLAYPLATNGELKGMLVLAGRAAAHVTPDTREFLPHVANQAYIVAENCRLFDRVRNLSMRDSLTELFNHRHSMELLNAEFQRVGRYEGGVSVVMVDIDDFKGVNDAHGHQVGDFVLREAARVMKNVLRTVDVLGRYGGEEFLAILPQTDYEAARQTAERLRVAIEKHAFSVGGRQLRITASLGVSTYPSRTVDSPGSLIRIADERLYRAKEDGKNRVE
jgi:diguanylate cyclase (GGDEF)-like protein